MKNRHPSANGAASFQPGATPQERRAPRYRGLKARANRRAVGWGFQPLGIFGLVTQGQCAFSAPTRIATGARDLSRRNVSIAQTRSQNPNASFADQRPCGLKSALRRSVARATTTVNRCEGVALGWNEGGALPLGNVTIAALGADSADVLGISEGCYDERVAHHSGSETL
jgi:hypothetical protein